MGDGGDWRRVGRAIAKRMDELGMMKAELIRHAGVSDKTLNGYIEGKPIVRADKRRGICEALGWSPDSIDRLRAGKTPLVLEGHAPGLHEQIRATNARIDELSARMDELLTHLARLDNALDAPQADG